VKGCLIFLKLIIDKLIKNYVMIATHVLSKNDDSINPVPKTNEHGKNNKKSTMFLYQWIDPIAQTQ
jgi:hypothetical protein